MGWGLIFDLKIDSISANVALHLKAVKKMKFAITIFIIFIAFTQTMNADLETIEGDNVDSKEYLQETIFVSLGSYCAPASLVRSCGHRKAAYPFDWNICMDGEKLIEILQEGFLNFLNNDYLVPFGWATLLNTYYHIEFVHDGSWEGNDSSIYMPILQDKYSRRIARFKNLNEHQGKVFFIRSAYINSLDDINRFYKISENIEISDNYALRLYEALRAFFPTLDFNLIIINNHETQNVTIEKRINDCILMVRAAPGYTEPVMQTSYEDFFNELLFANK